MTLDLPPLQRQLKNNLFERIQKSDLNIEHFELGETVSEKGFIEELSITYNKKRNSAFSFNADAPLSGKAWFSPGLHTWKEERKISSKHHILDFFDQWISALTHDGETPDLWTEFGQHKPSSDPWDTSTLTNDPFPPDEVQQLVARLEVLESKIVEKFELEGESIELLHEQLSYLSEGSKRLGRRDWTNIFITTIMGVTTALAFSPEKTQMLWKLIEEVLGNLPLLLPPLQ